MNVSKIKNLSAAVAAFGFFLMLLDRAGGPWAGTIIGTALLILGAVGAFRGPKIISALRLQFGFVRDSIRRAKTNNERRTSL